MRRGEVFGLLGPNGAGKTTTVEILEGYRARSEGTVSVLGHDPALRSIELRRRIGIVLQSGGIYSHITPREALAHWAGFYPHPRAVGEVLALAGPRATPPTCAAASSPAASCAGWTSPSPWSATRS